MNAQLLVIAKEPVAGRVKTRLCPPCTPDQAAQIARAALEDTLDAASQTPAARRVLLLSGGYPSRPGWRVTQQRGDGLAQRLANGFSDTALAGLPTLLIGMDTPQVTPPLLAQVAGQLSDVDGVLCPAEDGGWWALALRDPTAATALVTVPMSRPDTGSATFAALTGAGLSLRWGPMLRDVDTMADARTVAAQRPDSRFARAVAAERITA